MPAAPGLSRVPREGFRCWLDIYGVIEDMAVAAETRPRTRRGTDLFPNLIPASSARSFAACACLFLVLGTSLPLLAQDWTDPAWLVASDKLEQVRRQVRNSQQLSSNSPDPAVVTLAVEYGLSAMVAATDRPKELDLRLLRPLHVEFSQNARNKALEILLARVPALLTHPDANVRYNALSALAQASSIPAPPGSSQKSVPYNDALKVFIPVVVDGNQFLECRILAVRGLERILRDGVNAPTLNEKSDIADALVNALKANPPTNDDGRTWFRWSLIHALGFADRLDNSLGQPVVVDALINALHDPRESWRNRAFAGKSLSQLPWSGGVNTPLVTHEIAKLVLAMQTEVSRSQSPNTDAWREPFSVIYLSFMPEGRAEAAKNWGLLFQVKRPGQNANAPLVSSAYKVIRPIVDPFLDPSQKSSAANVAALRKWVDENVPADRSIVPGAAPLP